MTGANAAMATVTIHQWSDSDQGLRELRRVSRGPVVILTFDGDALDDLMATRLEDGFFLVPKVIE